MTTDGTVPLETKTLLYHLSFAHFHARSVRMLGPHRDHIDCNFRSLQVCFDLLSFDTSRLGRLHDYYLRITICDKKSTNRGFVFSSLVNLPSTFKPLLHSGSKPCLAIVRPQSTSHRRPSIVPIKSHSYNSATRRPALSPSGQRRFPWTASYSEAQSKRSTCGRR